MDDDRCSALEGGPALTNCHCAYGHAINVGCLQGDTVPNCVREDRVFDEDKLTVTMLRWKGQ